MERSITPLEEAYAAIKEFQPAALIGYSHEEHVRVFAPDLEAAEIARIAKIAKDNVLELALVDGCFELSEYDQPDLRDIAVPDEVAEEGSE